MLIFGVTPVFHMILRIILSLQMRKGLGVLSPRSENSWLGKGTWWETLAANLPVFTRSQTVLCAYLGRVLFLFLIASLISSAPSCGTWSIQINCAYPRLHRRKYYWCRCTAILQKRRLNTKKNVLPSKVLKSFKTQKRIPLVLYS